MFFTWTAWPSRIACRRRRGRPRSPTCVALQVAGRAALDIGDALRRAVVPDRLDVEMVGERRHEVGAAAGHDVDDAGRHVGGLEHLIEVGGDQRRARRAPRPRGCPWRSPARPARRRPSERRRVGADDADDAAGLVHRERHAADRDRMHRAVVLVGPGGDRRRARSIAASTSAPAASAPTPASAAMRRGELVARAPRGSRRGK